MRIKRKKSRRVFVLAGLVAAFFLVATTIAQLPPLPTSDKSFPKALIPVVEAERAFAEYSLAHGMKDAFLSFAAHDGIVVRRAPVNAIEAWTKTNPAPTGRLSWYPIYADVSRAGDLGYTTGPWEFRESSTDKDASGNGHFITLWRKQADGIWKFEMDMGISHSAPASRDTMLTYPAAARGAAGKDKSANDMDGARASLLEAERTFAKDATAKGEAQALLTHADAAVRLYRQNSFPFVGIEAARKALDGKAEVVTWQATKVNVARSADLGYAYGTYESKPKSADAKHSEQGNYMRIWKRLNGRWRIVLEVATPVPLPKQ